MIAVIVALAVTVFVTLNPAQRLAQARDAYRLSDVSSLQSALNLYSVDAAFAGQTPSLGATGTMYLSLPDPTATTSAGTNCAGLGFPSSGYHCPASNTYHNTDGTGWIPLNLASVPNRLSLSKLPVDPTNTSSSGEYYAYMTDGTKWEIAAQPEASANQTKMASFAAGTTRSLIALGWGGSGGSTSTSPITYTAATYATDRSPLDVAFDSNTNTVWVTNSNGADITMIDDTTYVASSSGYIANPNGIVFDPHTNFMWVTNYSSYQVTRINDLTGANVAYSGSYNSPNDIAFDSNTKSLWVTNYGSTTVTRIDDTTYAATIYSVGSQPTAIAFDSNTNSIWVTNKNTNLVTRIDDTTYATTTYAVGYLPEGVAFDSHTNTIWVANASAGTVTEINDTSYTSKTHTVGSWPEGIAFDPHTNSIWVANWDGNTVIQINDTTYATTTYAVGTSPSAVAFDSHNNSIWVTNYGDATVTVFVPSR